MNNILNNLIANFTNNNSNSNNQQNTYPNFNFSNQNKSNNLLNSILPMLLSGNGLPDLSALTNSNPLLSSILSTTQNKESIKKIESDKIDFSSLSKV